MTRGSGDRGSRSWVIVPKGLIESYASDDNIEFIVLPFDLGQAREGEAIYCHAYDKLQKSLWSIRGLSARNAA